MGSDKHDRVTPTVNLANLARSTFDDKEAPTSDVRPALQLSLVPWLMVTLDQLRELPIDPRAAFLVSLIDGQSSVDTIADVAGMPKSEVVEAFTLLVQLGAVELRDPAGGAVKELT